MEADWRLNLFKSSITIHHPQAQGNRYSIDQIEANWFEAIILL